MNIFSRFRKLTIWNKIGLVGALASIAGLFVAFVMSNNTKLEGNISTTGSNSPVITSEGDVSYSVNITNKNKTNPDLNKPKFKGLWDGQKAFSLAWPAPRKAEYEDGHEDKLEKDFFISINGIDKRIVLTTYYASDCQACQQLLSIFVFKKVGEYWVMEDESKDFMKVGREGFNEIGDSIEVWHIGPNRFGIVFSIVGWHQGDTFVTKQIYSFISGEIIKVMDALVHVYFSGLEKEEAIKEGYWFENSINLVVDRSKSSFGFFTIDATYLSSNSPKQITVQSMFNGDAYPIDDINTAQQCRGSIERYIERGKC